MRASYQTAIPRKFPLFFSDCLFSVVFNIEEMNLNFKTDANRKYVNHLSRLKPDGIFIFGDPNAGKNDLGYYYDERNDLLGKTLEDKTKIDSLWLTSIEESVISLLCSRRPSNKNYNCEKKEMRKNTEKKILYWMRFYEKESV